MPPLNSRVWRRYGQLRIYVPAADDPAGWSRHEADRASGLLGRASGLEVLVQPAIVFVGARKVTVRGGSR
jgi:hypothetical protein